jgi:ElaB/YqjD/DUF883 family membrane-anchored ribosome-binding protein
VGEGTAAGRAPVLSNEEALLAARADVLVARAEMEDELDRLEAAARAAVDVKAKIRRNPARAAGVAAGVGFLAVGGPRRVLRGTRQAIFGRPDPLPKSMLPDEIDKVLRSLGDDGEKVRGTIERDFASYLERTEKERRSIRSQLLFLGLPAARVLILRFGRQFIEEVLSTRGGFEEQMAKVRERRTAGSGDLPKAPGPGPAPEPRPGPRTG